MLRITSGIHRGRLLQAPAGSSTRPTGERLRQAWLNALQMDLPDARILDLFSGSGALGFEALSRGAAFVLFVEENPKAVKAIRENIASLGFEEQCKVLQKRIETVQKDLAEEGQFDLVFMDPPYHKGYEEKLLFTWAWTSLLPSHGKLCIESAFRKEGGFTPPQSLKIIRDERYGESQLTFYQKTEEGLES